MSIKAIIFDLDDTILDTSQFLIPVADKPEFFQRINQKLPALTNALELLQELSQTYLLFLLTIGVPQVQRQKIESLSIKSFFKDIVVLDSALFSSKEKGFSEILKKIGHGSHEILSVGNRRSTDIRNAKELGMQTCLLKYGEHAGEMAQHSFDIPDFEIENLSQLRTICRI